jgi:L-ectoine synthase
MKIIKIENLPAQGRKVDCPNGGFTSLRALLASDGMGFSLHKTIIPKGPPQHWHYKHHLEACYCIAGKGVLTNLDTGERFMISPDTVYVLDHHDDHTFEALTDTVLISVFNPPVTGNEVHNEDGSYTPQTKQHEYPGTNDLWER